MNILFKINFVFAFITTSTFAASFFTDAHTQQETPVSIAVRYSPDQLQEGQKRKIQIREEHNTCYDPYPPQLPSQEPTPEPVACIDLSTITNLDTFTDITITLRSTQTSTNYALQDIIGKNIHEYIKLLKKNNALQGEDRARYNYGGPISCTPELPQNVLSTLGIIAITGKTVITRDIAKQLSIHRCTLSFSFDSQLAITRSNNSIIFGSSQEIDEERRLEKMRIESFVRSTKRPPDRTTTSLHKLHHGYKIIKNDGQAKVISEWEEGN